MSIVEEKKCPPHHWIINSNDVGHCRFCPAVCDFGKLQRKAEKELGNRQAIIASETHKTGKPKGRKKSHEHL